MNRSGDSDTEVGVASDVFMVTSFSTRFLTSATTYRMTKKSFHFSFVLIPYISVSRIYGMTLCQVFRVGHVL